MLIIGGEWKKRKKMSDVLTFDPVHDIDWDLMEALARIGKEKLVLKKLSIGSEYYFGIKVVSLHKMRPYYM